ncbi:MAG: tetratricopeptide repeat protein [Comamonas sp.]|nr:tetratricopeptide repeat protein [Comamonas sp.]
MKKISQPLHSLRRRVTATVATALLVGASTAYANNADITSLLQGSQPEQALKLIDQRLSATPKDPQLRFLQGVAFAMANKNKEAIDTFTQLTKEFPELPEPYNNLAVLYANQNQLDKSRQALEQAIRTNPSYSTAHENLGDIYAKLASQAYSKALQLDGSHAQSVQPKLALIHDLFSTGQAQAQAQALAKAPSAPAPVTATATQAVSSSTTAPAQATVVAAAATAQPVASAQPATATPVTETASPPATEPKAETKTTAKAEPKAETKAETKAVATADAGQAAKADTPTAANVAEVEAAVHAWAKAWAAKDMANYLAAYSPNFQTPGKQSRKAWEAERRARIVGKRSISVNLADLTITTQNDRATARFRQHYRADTLNVSSRKTLQLELRKGQWLIVSETTGN